MIENDCLKIIKASTKIPFSGQVDLCFAVEKKIEKSLEEIFFLSVLKMID